MHLRVTHKGIAGIRKAAFAAIAVYFLAFSAAIPMVTYLCGYGEQRTVCVMDACDAGTAHDGGLTLSSPDCCIPQVTQAEVRSAVLIESGISHTVAAVLSVDDSSPNHFGPVLGVSHTGTDPSHHPPLFLQYRSLLI